MGLIDEDLIPFTKDHVLNRDLVIKMLSYEEEYTRSKEGQALYRDKLNRPRISLDVEKKINRHVLIHFKFDSTNDSLEMYRSIFKNYYQSPTQYDAEVLNSVHYMRNNKCVYYDKPIIQIGDTIPNCRLFETNGQETTLYDVIDKENSHRTFFAAFSLS